MSLRDIAVSVRRNPAHLKSFAVSREPIRPVIEDVSGEKALEANGGAQSQSSIIEAAEAPIKKTSYGSGTSVTAILREIELSTSVSNLPLSEVSWEKCKCLKRAGEKLFCTKFVRLCVQDKCPKKYIEN